jgi:hypothetical protein
MVNSSSGSPGSSGNQTGNTVTEQVKQQTQQAVGQVTQQATSTLASQKGQTAHGLTDVADALRQTGQQLQQKNQPMEGMAGQMIERAATGVDDVAGYLQNHDLNQIVGDFESFARRNSALFLGGAFVLGLAAARFLKSSPPSSQMGSGEQGGTGYYGRQGGYPRYDNVGGMPNVSYQYSPGLMGQQSNGGVGAYDYQPTASGTSSTGYTPQDVELRGNDGTPS